MESPAPLKAKVYRQAQSRFSMEFADWIMKLGIQELISLTQSESDGNVTAIIIYR